MSHARVSTLTHTDSHNHHPTANRKQPNRWTASHTHVALYRIPRVGSGGGGGGALQQCQINCRQHSQESGAVKGCAGRLGPTGRGKEPWRFKKNKTKSKPKTQKGLAYMMESGSPSPADPCTSTTGTCAVMTLAEPEYASPVFWKLGPHTSTRNWGLTALTRTDREMEKGSPTRHTTGSSGPDNCPSATSHTTSGHYT
jgi:hypothetical protein